MSRIPVLFLSILASLGPALILNMTLVESAHAAICYVDNDDDGFGVPPMITNDQDQCGPGYADNDLDCDDSSSDTYPGADDFPGDGRDQNCDGVDNCYIDLDLDSFGDAAGTTVPGSTLNCAADSGVSDNNFDCDDDDADVNPAAFDVPGDDVDQNCDAVLTCFVDADKDFWGSLNTTEHFGGSCDEPGSGVADDSLDCNDTNTAMFPGNPELCDGLDNDCDSEVDEGGVCSADADGDSVPDHLEVNGDSDGDGTDDWLDTDDDGDGVPTIDEDPNGNGDPTDDNTDNDGLPNYLDPDDDDDGYRTIEEDTDRNGNPADDDSDDDGAPDYLDKDSDDDNVPDLAELDTNSDAACDGSVCQADALPNRADPDDDGDGIPTIDEDRNRDGDPTNDDFDGDNMPDYLDTDAVPADVFEDGFEEVPVTYSIDFCRLQFPLVIDDAPGAHVTVYGRLYVDGLTDLSVNNDPAPEVIGYAGYGADSSDPASGWTWIEGVPNAGYVGAEEVNNDEYQAGLTLPGAGEYDFAFRFSGDGGETFTHCDGGDPGSSDGYQPTHAGQMTVSPP